MQRTIWMLITMATREENLKKINDELEKLSDEELDGIAGGLTFKRPINPQQPDICPTR